MDLNYTNVTIFEIKFTEYKITIYTKQKKCITGGENSLVKKAQNSEIEAEIKKAKKVLRANISKKKAAPKYPEVTSIIIPFPLIRCSRNPNVAVELIPYMNYNFGLYIMAPLGYDDSDKFKNIVVLDAYEQLVSGQSYSPEFKQAILNALYIGHQYAIGFRCPTCTQVEALMKGVPGLRLEAAKLMIQAWGSAHVVIELLKIDSQMDGLDWSYALYDWAFSLIELTPQDAAHIFEGLVYGVHLLNKTSITPGPGGQIPRNPP